MTDRLIQEMDTIMIELKLSVKKIKADYSEAGANRSAGANVNLFHYKVSRLSAVYTAPIQADLLDMDTKVISNRITRGQYLFHKRSCC